MKRIVLPFFNVCFLWTAKAISGIENNFDESSGEYDSVVPRGPINWWLLTIFIGGIVFAFIMQKKDEKKYFWLMPLAWCWPLLWVLLLNIFK